MGFTTVSPFFHINDVIYDQNIFQNYVTNIRICTQWCQFPCRKLGHGSETYTWFDQKNTMEYLRLKYIKNKSTYEIENQKNI